MGMGGGTTNFSGGLQPQFIFPSKGTYVAFIDFWPRMADAVQIVQPFVVGSAESGSDILPEVDDQPQPAGNLFISLKANQQIKARRSISLNFEAVDKEGQLRTEALESGMGTLNEVVITDDNLTTLLRPDFSDRHTLEFKVTFPKPGWYKIWFNFWYANRMQRTEFVINVK
jgi:hypothetical protein